LIYSGDENAGKQFLSKALELEPENDVAKEMIKNIKTSQEIKEQGSGMFKEGNFQGAVSKFKECL